MEAIKLRFWKFFVAALSLIVVATSCDLFDDDDDVLPIVDNPQEFVQGNWFGVFNTPVSGPDGILTDAVFVSFNGNNYQIVKFLNNAQVAGLKGTFSIKSLDEVIINVTHNWSEEAADWVSAGENNIQTIGIDITELYGPKGMTLIDRDKNPLFPVLRIVLEDPVNIAGEWFMPNHLLIINSNGNFHMTAHSENGAGTIRQISNVNGVNYLLMHQTSGYLEHDVPCNVYELLTYEMSEDNTMLTLYTAGATVDLFTYTEIQGDELDGHWLAVLPDVQDGPGFVPADIVYYVFYGNWFMNYSFNESEPAFGVMGEYQYGIAGMAYFTPGSVFSDHNFSWNELEGDQESYGIPIVVLPGGEKFREYYDDNSYREFVKVEPEVPVQLEGNWAAYDGEEFLASLFVESEGSFYWWQENPTGSQSGFLAFLGEVDGNNYMLMNFWWDDFRAEGESYYYTIVRYEFSNEGETFTLWHGDTVIELNKEGDQHYTQ